MTCTSRNRCLLCWHCFTVSARL